MVRAARTAGAMALVVLGFVVPAFASEIPNGSFEDRSGGTAWVSSIADWTLDPSVAATDLRAGIFFSVNGFSAVDGSSFGGITNFGGGAQILRSSEFEISGSQIAFSYVYATTNTPGDTTHKDPFTVTLVSEGDGDLQVNEVITRTVASVDSAGLSQGTIAALPWGSGPTYDIGWKTFTLEVEDLIGQVAYLEFEIGDSATGGGVSGIFLDGITQVPEPSTFILFGAGALGLVAWRRRHRTKQA